MSASDARDESFSGAAMIVFKFYPITTVMII